MFSGPLKKLTKSEDVPNVKNAIIGRSGQKAGEQEQEVTSESTTATVSAELPLTAGCWI